MTQKDVGTSIENLGNIIFWSGAFGLGAMAIVGTFAIDLVIMSALVENSKKNNKSASDVFFTIMLWNMLFSRNTPIKTSDYAILLILSPITSAIAIGLSFTLGVPSIGLGILVGWTVSLTALALGQTIYSTGEWLKDAPPLTEVISDAFNSTKNFLFFNNKSPSAPEIPMAYATPVF